MIESKMYLLSSHTQNKQILSHHNCRFLTVLNGSVLIKDDNKCFTLNKDDILYIPHEYSYQLLVQETSIILYIGFHPYFLFDAIGFNYKYIYYNSAENPLESSKDFRWLMASLASTIANKSLDTTCAIYAKAFELLYYVSKNFISIPNHADDTESKASSKINTLKKYISLHYNKAITLSDVANALDYTPQYLSNFIKKNLQITFNDLLNHYRLEAAVLLLKYTAENINKIAILCGFPNHSSFIKAFLKKYSVDPLKYTNYNTLSISEDYGINFTEIVHVPTILTYILNYMNYACHTNTFHNTSILQSNYINVIHKKPLNTYWKNLINLGCASDFEKPAFRNHLALIQNTLSFIYGRISGILDLTRIYKVEDEFNYDFSRIFEIFDFLKSIKLKPFLDIDNKPFRIYKEEDSLSVDYSTFLNTEKYDKFLLAVLPYFIRACINRYGFDEFSTWKFELWRRYNPSMTSLESPKSYFKRFCIISDIFKSMQCHFSLGGPGFNSFLNTNNFEQLISVFKNSTYSPDFISAYYFPYTPATNESRHAKKLYNIEQSPNTMLQKISDLKSSLEKNGFAHIPFYITEYTPYIITGNYVNDSTYPATHIFRQVIENYGKVEALGYWLASDVSLDYKIPSAPLFGGNGIISRDGIKKPSYYAFDFLNKLGPFLIARGEHYIITASDEYSIQILIYYNSDINNYFQDDPMSSELLHYPYYGFVQSSPLELQLYLTNVHPGTYSIKETTLDLTHGNILNIWGQLNHMKNMRPTDIEYMKNQSTPSVLQHMDQVSDTFLLHTTIGPNEAKLFTLNHIYNNF